VGDGISVMPQITWNASAVQDELIWTRNGATLDSLHFLTNIKPEHPLYRVPTDQRGQSGNSFSTSMLPNDIEDLLVTTLQHKGFENVRGGNLSPCPFGNQTGFCFTLDFATEDGLVMKGKAIALKRADRLDVFEFYAAAEYYYDSLAPTVDRLFGSIRVK
jgi:hypothetical protein